MLHDDPKNKKFQPIDIMYKNIQIHIWRAFGYQYEFIYAKQVYAGQYDTLEHAKVGAMLEIDKVLEKKLI